MIALDSNLLIYAHRQRAAEHLAARRAMERAFDDAGGCGISMPTVGEFWSAVTHPSAIGGSAAPRRAAQFIESLIDGAGVRIWIPSDGFARRLLELATDLSVVGPRIFDLQIGLIALENGADEIWTHDRQFISLRGLRVYDPLEFTRREE